MFQRALLSCVFIAAMPSLSPAQTGFVDVIDHIHLAAPDQAKAVEWYRANFGAALTSEGPDRAMLGTTRLIFQKSEMPKPSQGSVLEMIGFSVADLDGAMKTMQAAGVRVVMQPMIMQGVRSAQVMDPWGTTIDVVQDPKKLGLHHIALVAADPAATLAWFAETFGGKVAKFQGGDGIDVGGVWLTARKGASEPSAGHSIDHIGFRPVNVDNTVTAMKAKNIKVTTEPRPLVLPSGTAMRLAFIEGPGGVRIELVQRDNLK
jgi:catechol 2,3-dioxygenase-like lactoylglutathione lyase family enzyme